MKSIKSYPGGIASYLGDTQALVAAGASNIIPASQRWIMHSIQYDVVATATVGNRVIYAGIQMPDGGYYIVGPSSAAVTAGQTCGYDIGFGCVGATTTTVRRNIARTANTNVQVNYCCPARMFPAGTTFRLFDATGVDITDAVTIRFIYERLDL